MEQLKISIIMPTLNVGKYIAQALTSIRRQRYENCEVIIVDGGSVDDTVEVAKRYSDLNITILSGRDRGQAEAVTKGLMVATGDIAHWHAADDILLPGALKTVSNYFEKDKALGLLFSDGLAFDGRHIYAGACVRHVTFETSLAYFGRFQSDCAYWRHHLTPTALPLDTSMPLCCDEDFFLRLWAHASHTWCPEPLGGFRIRTGQVSGSVSRENLSNDRARTRTIVARRLELSNKALSDLRRKVRWRYWLGTLVVPRCISLCRFVGRKAVFDWPRRRYERWFFEEWLSEE